MQFQYRPRGHAAAGSLESEVNSECLNLSPPPSLEREDSSANDGASSAAPAPKVHAQGVPPGSRVPASDEPIRVSTASMLGLNGYSRGHATPPCAPESRGLADAESPTRLADASLYPTLSIGIPQADSSSDDDGIMQGSTQSGSSSDGDGMARADVAEEWGAEEADLPVTAEEVPDEVGLAAEEEGEGEGEGGDGGAVRLGPVLRCALDELCADGRGEEGMSTMLQDLCFALNEYRQTGVWNT